MGEQIVWQSNMQLKIYFAAFFYMIMLQGSFQDLTAIFFLLFCIWPKQIYNNAVYGYKNVPDPSFALISTLHVSFIPLYFHGSDENFLLLKPNHLFFWLSLAWLALQLTILLIQRKYPRFILPRKVQLYLQQGYYRYERRFEEDACLSNGTYSSQLSQFKELKELDPEQKLEFKRELRLERLTNEECIVCLEPMSRIPQGSTPGPSAGKSTSIFFMTPCNHRFHKRCLKDWMIEKQQCPVCRAILPQYNSF
uniref:RING-type E3 ubiquitin transferase n=1 Tax=Strombidium rassoulzadegani TaxID=1082188 RepID=A0A7S3FWT2_9SPIT|mmetsp:Transcript_8922/g.15119  ORF Transcript_8922/g.15119 Transcript_8922/m.15119 type:complete len:251 (+) Transcript_8922:1579-2331(+)